VSNLTVWSERAHSPSLIFVRCRKPLTYPTHL